MARFAVFFTVIFLLFTFSHARFFTAEPEQDVTPEETIANLPESDPKTSTAILLPSERPGFEPAKIVDFKHDDASETDPDVESDSLKTISFHPVNRHFPRRPLIPFRHKHNCRFHKRFRPLNPRFQQKRYISYGDDMILSDERTRFDPESRGVVRQIQTRWARFPDDGAESKEQVDFMKPHHHDHEHEHDHDHDDDHHHHHHHRRHHHGEEDEMDEEEEHEHENEHEGGFMRRLSKFYNHF
ncbi:hypothetical protein CRYUN_Cryun13aG0108700 [Craigia yunnanensis]